MRPSSPELVGGVRRRRGRPGRRRRRRSGSPRPTSSTSPAAASTCPARCSPPATTRRSTTASSCAAPAPARRPGHRPGRDPRTWPSTGVPDARRAGRAPSPHGTCSRRTPRTCATWSTLPASAALKVVVDAGNGMGGHTVPTVLAGLPLDLVPLYFELDGTFPNHEANPLDPANLRRPAGAGASPRAPTSAWPSTATPTAASSSTSAASPVVAVGDHRAGRRPRAGQAPRRDGDPQPDHLAGGARRSSASTAARRCAPGSATRSSRPRWPRTDAVFGGEHSAHYYFRDFWRADTGMLAALHVLAALGEQDEPLSAAGRRRTSATSRPARSTARWPTRRPPPRPSGTRSRTAPGVDGRRAGRADRRRGRTGGSTCGRPTPSRCCGSTSRRPTAPTMEQLRDEVLAHRPTWPDRPEGDLSRAARPAPAGDPGLPAVPRRRCAPTSASAERAGLHVGHLRARLPGPRRHPGAADRRGPTAVSRRGSRTTPPSTTPLRWPTLDRGGMLRAVATAGAQVREALRAWSSRDAARSLAGRPAARRRGRRDGRLRASPATSRPPSPAGPARCPWSPHRGPPAARLGRPDGPGGRGVLLGRHRGDAVGHRRGAAPGRPGGHGRRGRLAARRPQRRRPGAAPAGRRARPDAAGEPVGTRRARCSWSLDALGLADVPRDLLSPARPTSWTRLRRALRARRSTACDNPAKALALELAGTLPYVWGASEVASVAAARTAAQLAENAKYPAVHGALPEVHHNQVVVMAGAFGALASDGADDDIFRDRVDDGAGPAAAAAAAAARHRRGARGRRAGRTRRTGSPSGTAWRAASCAPRASTRWPGWPAWSRRSTSPRVYLALRAGHRPHARSRRSSR